MNGNSEIEKQVAQLLKSIAARLDLAAWVDAEIESLKGAE